MNDTKSKTARKSTSKSANINAKSPRKSQEKIIRNNLYRVTIEKTFNCQLFSACTVGKDTVEFLGWDSQEYFRVLKGFNENTYEFWLNHYTSPRLILDIEDIPYQVKRFSECKYDLLVINKKVAKSIWYRRNLLIYHNGALWDYHGKRFGKRSYEHTWKMMPVDPNYQLRIDAENNLA